MRGEIPNPEIRSNIVSARNRIIADITSRGLFPGALLRAQGVPLYRSNGDDWGKLCDTITGVILTTTHPGWNKQYYAKRTTQLIDERLCHGPNSVLPVIAERGDSIGEIDKKSRTVEWTRRLQASFLVVCNALSLPFEHVWAWDFNSSPTYSTFAGNIPSELFTHLLFPKHIWDGYNSYKGFKKTPANVTIIEDIVQERLFHNTPKGFELVNAIAPNYKRALSEILQRDPTNLWIHGVRLPTYGDDIPNTRLTHE